MKKKIEFLINWLKLAVRKHPVEVVLSVVFSLAGCVYFEYGFGYSFLAAPLAYFPVLFLIILYIERTDRTNTNYGPL